MQRRDFVLRLGGATAAAIAWPLHAPAQPRGYRIALLVTGGHTANIQALTDTLQQLGYSEGKNTAIERRFAEGKLERLAAFAAELVNLKPDIIVTQGTPATIAAKQATSSIPIVFMPLSDPVGVGLVASLARPGGNVTGTSLM